MKTRELLLPMTKVGSYLPNPWRCLVIFHLNSPWLLLKPQLWIIEAQPLQCNNEAILCWRAAWKCLVTAAGSFSRRISCPECKKNRSI